MRPATVDDREIFEEVAAEARRTLFARRFYNNAVAATSTRGPGAWCAGRVSPGACPAPHFFEIDDDPPVMLDQAPPGPE